MVGLTHADAPRVLVLDGETRAALSVVRSLGAAGYEIAVGSHRAKAIAAASKYCDIGFRYPPLEKYPDRFVHWLSRTIELWQPSCVLPITDSSLGVLLDFEDTFRQLTVLPTVSRKVFREASDKLRLAEIASTLGIRVPKTVCFSTDVVDPAAIEEALAPFSFPVVVKPRRSVLRSGASVFKPDMHYAESAQAVYQVLSIAAGTYSTPIEYMVQERITGVGVGAFALCVKGEVLMQFAHRRVLEKPPSGGRSVLCESLPEADAPLAEAARLLKHFHWDGVAMVEFKQDQQGSCFLMEINPRFWGSLQLAVDSGRDFPKALVDVACFGQQQPEILQALRELPPYREGQRLRWLLGSLDHFLIRLKAKPFQTMKDTVRKNALHIRLLDRRCRTEVLRLDDLRPFLLELRQYCSGLLGFDRSSS